MYSTVHKTSDHTGSKSRIVVSVTKTAIPASNYASSVSSEQTSCDDGCMHQTHKSADLATHVKHAAYSKDHAVIGPRVRVNSTQRTRERMRLAYTFAVTTYRDLKSFYGPISESHRFSHRVVDPLFTWHGQNIRVVAGKSLGTTIIEDAKVGYKTVIHAGSHNYAGFYRMTDDSEHVHKLALDHLQIAPYEGPEALSEAFHAALRAVFQAEFCYTTSTGYASNLLAFSAILRPGWLCIMDAKSHNSMHVGAYVSNADRIIKFRHNDMSHLEELLIEHSCQHEHVLVAVEGLFSMDGTIPPLVTLARLKQTHAFILLIDEAHSLLSVGKTGKGCVELWNDTHPDAPVDDDIVDLRTAVLSKTLGAIGGMVCGKQEFATCVEARHKQMRTEGFDPVLTATMVQCLYVLGQPALLQRRLARMRSMSQWARTELKRYGVHVYGDATTPLLPIHTGRASTAARLSYKLRKNGVLATPVSIPAVSFWQSRIRVCLSADHTDAQLNTLIQTIINCSQNIGIVSRSCLRPHNFITSLSDTQANDEAVESLQISQHIEHLIQKDILRCSTKASSRLRQAGHESRQKFGMAAGGARWISGTFSVHVEVEKLIGDVLKLQDAIIYSDSYVGLLSTVSALCRPLLKCKAHRVFLPMDCPQAVFDGIKAAPKSTSPTVSYYQSLTNLENVIASTVVTREQTTIYLPTSCINRQNSSFPSDQDSMGGTAREYITILLHDTECSLRSIHQREAISHIVDKLHRITRHVLVYGDFMSNFGVPGSYLAGSRQLVEELRYSSRGYMFSTACLPFVTGMVKSGLQNPSIDA